MFTVMQFQELMIVINLLKLGKENGSMERVEALSVLKKRDEPAKLQKEKI